MSTSINITDLNIPENLRTGDRISCRMGDETIEAEVTVTPKLLRVQLKVFWHEIRATRKIQEDAPVLFTKDKRDDSCANARGRFWVKELFEGLCHDLAVLLDNSSEIYKRLPHYKSLFAAHHRALWMLESRESEANKNLETGQITQTDYMRIMKSISLKRDSLEKMISDSFKRVYADLVQQCTHAEDLKLLVESRMIFVR